jgi:hypothetical protein
MVFLAMLLAAKPSLTVVVRGAPAEVVSAALSSRADVELRVVPPPNVTGLSAALSADERIAAARKAYVDADFNKCLGQVSDDAAVYTALEQRDRTGAARLLLWRIACEFGSGRKAASLQHARDLAAMRLDVPADVAQVSPEVEAVISSSLRHAAQDPAMTLDVSSNGEAAVELDGRPAGCSTPCMLDVLQGSHVVRVSEEGKEPAAKTVQVTGKASAAFTLRPAGPELAAAQWTARYANAADADSARSATLLSTALRASRLVMLTVETAGRQQALLSVDGNVTARAERNGALTSELPGLMDDLLVRGQLIEPQVPVYKRPLFWIALVAGVAAVAAGTTALVVTAKREAMVSF